MPKITFQVTVEVDTLESHMPREKVIEYIRVGIQNAIVRESQCISLLPPSIMNRREKIQTTVESVEE
jgi:hypothetical protein